MGAMIHSPAIALSFRLVSFSSPVLGAASWLSCGPGSDPVLKNTRSTWFYAQVLVWFQFQNWIQFKTGFRFQKSLLIPNSAIRTDQTSFY